MYDSSPKLRGAKAKTSDLDEIRRATSARHQKSSTRSVQLPPPESTVSRIPNTFQYWAYRQT